MIFCQTRLTKMIKQSKKPLFKGFLHFWEMCLFYKMDRNGEF